MVLIYFNTPKRCVDFFVHILSFGEQPALCVFMIENLRCHRVKKEENHYAIN